MNRFTLFNNMLFSDEAHFHINGYTNKQNCRYWSCENPNCKSEKPLHSHKVTVWAAMSAHGIIGPRFLRTAEVARLLLLRSDMWAIIKDIFTSELQNFPGFNTRTWF